MRSRRLLVILAVMSLLLIVGGLISWSLTLRREQPEQPLIIKDNISGEEISNQVTGGTTGDQLLILGIQQLVDRGIPGDDIAFVSEYISYLAISKYGKQLSDRVSIKKDSLQFLVDTKLSISMYSFRLYIDDSRELIVKLITPFKSEGTYSGVRKLLRFELSNGELVAEYKLN